MPPSFRDSIALHWDPTKRKIDTIPFKELAWSVSDSGTLFGAILVERFRSYGGRLLDLSDYERRLHTGASEFGIDWSAVPIEVKENAERLLSLNGELLRQHGDLSFVFLLSPGPASAQGIFGQRPTLMMHVSQLPFATLDQWYQTGVDLLLGSCQVVPNTCWPNQIKCRSRLPYFLSDALAARQRRNALSVLTTSTGCIADTSVANLLLVNSRGDLTSPKKEDILVGCTLQAIERLLLKRGVAISYVDITSKMLHEASEVILTGSNGGVWFARSVDGVPIGSASSRSQTKQLTDLWKRHVDFDFVGQAANYRSQ